MPYKLCIYKMLSRLIPMTMLQTDFWYRRRANEKNKLGLRRSSPFANVTQLATGGGVAVRSPGRLMNKG